jgi:hypothetical protein
METSMVAKLAEPKPKPKPVTITNSIASVAPLTRDPQPMPVAITSSVAMTTSKHQNGALNHQNDKTAFSNVKTVP